MPKSIDLVNHSAEAPVDAVVEAIHEVMHLFRAQQFRALRDGPHDLTHMDGKVLSFFARHPGATASELAAHSGRDKGQLARLVGGLKERGLLEPRADEADRRSVRLHLTAEGRAVHQALQRQRQRLAAAAVAGLGADERGQLLALLGRIRGNLTTGG